MLTQWLWTNRGPAARLTRLALVPLSLGFRVATALRARAYRSGLLPSRVLPLPAVGVGNLTVGGSGKTPIANWIATFYAAQGLRPAVLLRGYGGDEGPIHRGRDGDALVFEDPDRWAAAERAVAGGADVLVLDDAFQHFPVRPDLQMVLVSAESMGAVRWTLPAGPWREGWGALRRADLLVVTRKRADRDTAAALARRLEAAAPGRPVAIAYLALGSLRGLLSGEPVGLSALNGAAVAAAAGIADPPAFAAQLKALGARVTLTPWRDHAGLGTDEVDHLLHVQPEVDYVVVTEKDAVKLRRRWPGGDREPLVAVLDVHWETGEAEVEAALLAAAGEQLGHVDLSHERGA